MASTIKREISKGIYRSISAWWLATRIKRHLSTKNFRPKCTFGYLTNLLKPIIDKTLDYLQKHNSTFIGNTPITQLKIKNNKIINIMSKNKKIKIDVKEKVVSTLPLFVTNKI